MITVLILGLMLSHAVGFILYSSDRRDVMSTSEAFNVAERVSGVVVLLRYLPEDWRAAVLNAADSRAFRVWQSDAAALPPSEMTPDEEAVLAYLRALLPRLASRDMRVAITKVTPPDVAPPDRVELPGAPAGGSVDTAAQIVTVSVSHPDGFWLNFVGAIPELAPMWPSLLGGYLISVAFGVSVIAFWLVRRATKPLEEFGSAADRLGKDIQTEPLNESGPAEVAQAARAFNRMQKRLARLVRNRTELLAAISHDLRTPITQLKLRAELVEQDEEREKFLTALGEMELIIATFLDYANSSFGAEERSRIDLGSLVESICSDLADSGADVEVVQSDRIFLGCKRLALKRGVTNLIENAVKYGNRARVSTMRRGCDIIIQIEDDGPGIEEESLEEMLMPFRRGDPSRSRETGGIGLGLSIAQAVAHDHGGRLSLHNRPEGGLRAMFVIPV